MIYGGNLTPGIGMLHKSAGRSASFARNRRTRLNVSDGALPGVASIFRCRIADGKRAARLALGGQVLLETGAAVAAMRRVCREGEK